MGYNLGRPRKIFVQLGKTAPQDVLTSTLTPVTWDAEEFDPYGFHAPGASQIVIPTGLAGFYTLSLNLLWTNNGLGYRQVELHYRPVGGSFAAIGTNNIAAFSTELAQMVTFSPGFQLQEGDALEWRAFQTSATTLQLLRRSVVYPGFHMTRIS